MKTDELPFIFSMDFHTDRGEIDKVHHIVINGGNYKYSFRCLIGGCDRSLEILGPETGLNMIDYITCLGWVDLGDGRFMCDTCAVNLVRILPVWRRAK